MTLDELRIRARRLFGPHRARELDPAIIEMARDLDTLGRFEVDPDVAP